MAMVTAHITSCILQVLVVHGMPKVQGAELVSRLVGNACSSSSNKIINMTLESGIHYSAQLWYY